MPCSAWPNSWKIVVTLSNVSSAGWPGAGFGEVSDVEDGRLRADEARLIDEAVHPRAAALVRTREVVAVVERHRFAVGVEDLEHAHVRLIDRDVVALLEREPVELIGGVEDAVLQDVVELEVRPHLRFIEVVLGLADLLGVELPVVRRELEAAVFRVDDGLHLRDLGMRFRDRCGNESGQQLDGVLGSRGHLIVEGERGVGRVSEELGFVVRGAARGA